MIATIFGIFLIAIGAFMSGSFAVPFDKVKGWKWENQWFSYSLFAYVVVPLLVCMVVTPNFLSAIANTNSAVIGIVFSLGAIYGIANLTFGLSLRYLGISLGFSLSLGLMMAFGTLIPPLIDGKLMLMFENGGGVLLIAGVLLSIVGISISGYAGYLKSKNNDADVNSQIDLKKGVGAALLVGILGTASPLGIEQGKPLADLSMEMGTAPLFRDNIVFLVLYSGAFLSTLLWCLVLSIKGKSLINFIKTPQKTLLNNYLMCALAGFLWFINFIFYGMGKSQLGEFSFVAWGILMTITIVCATLWGIFRGEWKGTTLKVNLLMWLGLILLFAASFLIAMSSI